MVRAQSPLDKMAGLPGLQDNLFFNFVRNLSDKPAVLFSRLMSQEGAASFIDCSELGFGKADVASLGRGENPRAR